MYFETYSGILSRCNLRQVWDKVTIVANIPISKHFCKKKNTIKERISTTLNSYYYKNDNNNKYQQGDMNKRVQPRSQDWHIAAGAYPGFCSMKRLGVFLLPQDGILVHRRSLPSN